MKKSFAMLIAGCVVAGLTACAQDMSKEEMMKKEAMMKKEEMMKKDQMKK